MLRGLSLIFIALLPFYLFSQDTELKLYRPFGDADPLVPIFIKEQIVGECWQQSQRIKRQDAWRCSAQGKIYDPCFIKASNSSVSAICPQSPWIGNSTQINLRTTVDNSQHAELDMSATYPWALELTSGEKCQAIDEGEMHEGLSIRYHCDNQSVLIGKIQRCKPSWHILQRSKTGISTAVIGKAWF